MHNTSIQLKKLRQFLNLTQDEFAERINTKRNSVSMIESGKNKPTFEMISDIYAAFNISSDYFLSTDNPENYIEAKVNINDKIDNINDGVNTFVDDGVNRKKIKKEGNINALYNNVDQAELNIFLQKMAQSNLLYLEFHLTDIELNLKLLQEKITGDKFDRKEYENSLKTLKNACKTMKGILNTGYASNSSIIGLMGTLDGLMRDVLDHIREFSKDLYLNN